MGYWGDEASGACVDGYRSGAAWDKDADLESLSLLLSPRGWFSLGLEQGVLTWGPLKGLRIVGVCDLRLIYIFIYLFFAF